VMQTVVHNVDHGRIVQPCKLASVHFHILVKVPRMLFLVAQVGCHFASRKCEHCVGNVFFYILLRLIAAMLHFTVVLIVLLTAAFCSVWWKFHFLLLSICAGATGFSTPLRIFVLTVSRPCRRNSHGFLSCVCACILSLVSCPKTPCALVALVLFIIRLRHNVT